MQKKSEPEKVNLTAEEAEALKQRIPSKELSAEDIKLMIGLITFNLWLQQQLSFAKISIKKLKRFFGFSTEKKTVKKVSQ